MGVNQKLLFLPLFPFSKAASSPGEFRDLYAGSEWGFSVNGSLALDAAKASHSGRYLCTVSNGVGQDLNAVVDFRVQGKISKCVVYLDVIFPDVSFFSSPRDFVQDVFEVRFRGGWSDKHKIGMSSPGRQTNLRLLDQSELCKSVSF